MSNMNLKTMRAYNIRQSFQDIYQADTQDKFIQYLNKWYESRINNGILEGLNSVIQAAKSKARGYKTFKNYKIIVYLLTGKLNFSLVNSKFREI